MLKSYIHADLLHKYVTNIESISKILHQHIMVNIGVCMTLTLTLNDSTKASKNNYEGCKECSKDDAQSSFYFLGFRSLNEQFYGMGMNLIHL